MVRIKSLLCSRGASFAFIAIGFVFAVAFSLWSPATRSTEYLWSPVKGDQGGRFELTRGWPQEFELQADCQKIRDGGDGLIFTSGGLTLEKISNELRLRSTPTPKVDLSLVIPASNCDVRSSFNASSGQYELSTGNSSKQVTVDKKSFARFDRLETGAQFKESVVEVRLVTRPWGVHHTISRALLGIVAFIFISLAVFSCFLRNRMRSTEPMKFHPRVSRQGISIAAFLALASFVIPPFLDDGWVIATTRNFTTTGVMSGIYDAGDTWLPLGNTHMAFVGILDFLGFPYIWLRLFTVVIIVAAWEVLRRFVLEEMIGAKQKALWVSAALFACFSAAWLVSLRAEPWVVFFTSIAWAGFARFRRDNSDVALFVALLGAGLAFNVHQSGWVAVPLGGAALFIAGKRIKAKVLKASDVVVPLIGAGSLVVINLLFFYGPKDFLEGVRDFSSQPDHAGSYFTELTRYVYLLSSSGTRVTTILILGVFVLVSAFVVDRSDPEQIKIWGLTVLSMAALVMTASKWQWHLGAYSFFAAIFVALAFTRVEEKKDLRAPFYLLLIPGIILAAAFTIENTVQWGYFDLVGTTWKKFGETFGANSHVLAWGLLLIGGAGIAFVADYRERPKYKTAAASVTIAAIMLMPTLSLGWIGVHAAANDVWSIPRQNVEQLFGDDLCDVPRFATEVFPLQTVSSNSTGATPLVVGAYPKSPSIDVLPQGFGNEGWGTQTPLIDSVMNISNSQLQKYFAPSYLTNGNEFVAAAIARSSSKAFEFDIEFQRSDGALVSTKRINPEATGIWEINYIKVPAGTSSARIVVTDKSKESGTWAATSALQGVVAKNSLEVNESGATLVGPFERQKYPCLEIARPYAGAWPQISYLTQEEIYFFAQIFGTDIKIEGPLCGVGDLACLRQPYYNTAQVTRRDL